MIIYKTVKETACIGEYIKFKNFEMENDTHGVNDFDFEWKRKSSYIANI